MKPGEKRKTLNNGLTNEQVAKAREVLAKVTVSKICEALGVKRSTLENVLRDQSKEVDVLRKVLIEAKKQIKQQEKAIKALPI